MSHIETVTRHASVNPGSEEPGMPIEAETAPADIITPADVVVNVTVPGTANVPATVTTTDVFGSVLPIAAVISCSSVDVVIKVPT